MEAPPWATLEAPLRKTLEAPPRATPRAYQQVVYLKRTILYWAQSSALKTEFFVLGTNLAELGEPRRPWRHLPGRPWRHLSGRPWRHPPRTTPQGFPTSCVLEANNSVLAKKFCTENRILCTRNESGGALRAQATLEAPLRATLEAPLRKTLEAPPRATPQGLPTSCVLEARTNLTELGEPRRPWRHLSGRPWRHL